MKTDKEKYPEETRYMFYSSILIRLSLVFIFGIPVLVFFEIMETYTYLSFFILPYVYPHNIPSCILIFLPPLPPSSLVLLLSFFKKKIIKNKKWQ